MYYIGLMSGTSADGINAVVVKLGEPEKFALLASYQCAYPAAIRSQIESLLHAGEDELERASQLNIALGRLFADAALTVLKYANLDAHGIRAIGSHGQTLRHRPNTQFPYSLQVGDPSVIAELTGISTVADFRSRDMACGGQGAPLVPAFHQWLFQNGKTTRAVVNIGGIANVSYLPADPTEAVIGFDTGPGNTLLDNWIHREQGKSYDPEGNWAASGKLHAPLLDRLLQDPYFKLAPPKSTGREYFHLEWLLPQLQDLQLSPQDVQTTLVELTAISIARALQAQPKPAKEVYLCGGGTHNRYLVERIQNQLGKTPVATTQALGLDPDWVEACAFAWLAHQTLEGRPGNLPSVTGARRPVILGGIYQA